MTTNANPDITAAYQQFHGGLRQFIIKRVDDPSIADDILHDIFIKLMTTLQAGKRLESIAAWLYAVSRTTIVDYFRANGRMLSGVDDDIAAEEHTPSAIEELGPCLQPFIDSLPANYQHALNAADINGSKLKDIAEQQGLSVSAIKSRVSRGRKLLHQQLLACCEFEMEHGQVSDYYRKPKPCC